MSVISKINEDFGKFALALLIMILLIVIVIMFINNQGLVHIELPGMW